jgi:uncharacterized protein YecE (DUF72 family)
MRDQLAMFEASPRPARRGAPSPAPDSPLRLQPPPGLYLGTSSWSFPGWKDLVWDAEYPADELARHGLAAYSALGLLRTVGIDRTFYEFLPAAAFAEYAAQVDDGFRFVVKAPQQVTDAVRRGEKGRALAANPHWLDGDIAIERFVVPVLEGLRHKAGPLVFQFPPMPAATLDPAPWVERLGIFLESLPRSVSGISPIYAVELRNRELLTPRLVRMLSDVGGRLVLGLHDRMPGPDRQIAALRRLDACPRGPYAPAGPVVVRWNLRPGLRYEQAKGR